MKTLVFWLVLFLSVNGFPIESNRAKRSTKEKEDQDESLNITEVARRSCDFGKHFVGSNLFDGKRKVCFSMDDVNLLIARRDFEMMIPRDLPQNLLDDKTVGNIMRYFYYGLWLLRRIDDCQIRRTMEKAFYDTLGGFLGYYLVPVCKFSYYASKVELRTVRNVMALHQKCRSFLNTNGNGWRPPLKDPCAELANVRIEPLKLMEDSESCDDDKTYCADLDLATASSGMEIVDDNMIVSLPKIELEDPEGYLSNIWLPFARKRTYNLRSCKSAFIFVKFYRSVSNCYKQKGMERKAFDHKFRQWIVENIKVHLGDEMFYPGLGGILNVYESLRTCNKRMDVAAIKDNDDLENALKAEDEKSDYGSLIEENSRAFADIIEGPNPKLRKRAINDEEMEYMHNFQFNMPMDPEEKKADDWIEAFDESTLHEFQRDKIIKTKCKPKCKKLRNKPEAGAAATDSAKLPQGPSAASTSTSATEDAVTPPIPPPPLPAGDKVLATTSKIKVAETGKPPTNSNPTTTQKPQKDTTTKTKAGEEPTTTPKPPKAENPTKPPKAEKPTMPPKPPKAEKPTKPPKAEKPSEPEQQPTSSENKRRILLFLISILFLLLILLLLIAIILCCRKYGKDTMERLKQRIQQLEEKMRSKKQAAPTPAAPPPAKPADAAGKKGAAAAAPADKGAKGKPADKKPEKADAKPESKVPDKNAEKAAKKGDKPDKKDEKAAKEAEKAAKKAEKAAKKGEKPDKAAKEAEKAAKKGAKAAKEERRAKKRNPRSVFGIITNPSRSRQKRGGRSPSAQPK